MCGGTVVRCVGELGGTRGNCSEMCGGTIVRCVGEL